MLLQYRDDISYRIVLENIHRYGFNLIHQHINDRSHVSALGFISTFDCSVRRGYKGMVLGFITTYAISAYHH